MDRPQTHTSRKPRTIIGDKGKVQTRLIGLAQPLGGLYKSPRPEGLRNERLNGSMIAWLFTDDLQAPILCHQSLVLSEPVRRIAPIGRRFGQGGGTNGPVPSCNQSKKQPLGGLRPKSGFVCATWLVQTVDQMNTTDTPPAPPLNETAALLRHRPYMLFWAAKFTSVLAVQVQAVAIAWQVYALARLTSGVREAAFIVGMIGLAQFVALLALTLNAGETADRHDRRLIMIISLTVEVLCAGGLLLLARAGHPQLWPIIAIALVFGGARAFFSPASGAMGPMLVPRELLPKAVAWNSLAWQSASIFGPAIGGILCAVSAQTAYAGALILFSLSILMLALIRANTRPVLQPGSRAELIKEGLVYVWTNKIVLGAISLDLFAVLLGGATALLPVYAKDILHVGAEGFGILRTAPAIGASAVAILLAFVSIRRRAGLFMFASVALFGLATIVFGLSKLLWLSVAALAVLGAADMVSVYIRQTLVQIVTPDVMRGRVSAVSGLFIGASNELGEFESGVAARLLGPIGAAVFGGVGAIIVTGLWASWFPALRKADRLA